VRNIGAIEDNKPASDNDWETVKRGGDRAIQTWIDEQLRGRSCVVVLIGSATASRKWIQYEIAKGWNDGKGVVGVYIHRLKDRNGYTATKGANPFDHVTLQSGGALSKWVKAYDPAGYDSKAVYQTIANSLDGWIEEAIKIRNNA
jgi:hypothetical protein